MTSPDDRRLQLEALLARVQTPMRGQIQHFLTGNPNADDDRINCILVNATQIVRVTHDANKPATLRTVRKRMIDQVRGVLLIEFLEDAKRIVAKTINNRFFEQLERGVREDIVDEAVKATLDKQRKRWRTPNSPRRLSSTRRSRPPNQGSSTASSRSRPEAAWVRQPQCPVSVDHRQSE